VLVAEFFLQRTPANRVAEFYPLFLERFPSLEKLATANPKHLEQLGHRLGLKKRMSWLVHSAKKICREHKGKIPDKFDDLIKLPGIGQYTASAILCFGYKKNVPIIDANVIRVLKRMDGLCTSRRANTATIKKILCKLLPGDQTVTFNEAILDFAATICKKRPLCEKCPLSHLCVSAPVVVAAGR
jgi:A/G-specific adenine glycosylase